MGDPFFSVIVPEHNSAAFMLKGLDSIADQTFRDYELIVVCDRCTDDTAEMAKSYDVKVPEISVLEVDNGKCGLTRNKGLDIARGEWVIFADDDDWFLHPYVFEIMHEKLKESDCDILACGFVVDWRDGRGLHEETFLNPNNSKLWVAPWTKIWRRSFIGDHRFQDWKHSDDLGFAQEMFPLIKNLEYTIFPIYYYNYMREGSIQHKLSTGELSNDDMKG